MKFGVFDHLDRGNVPLTQHYENRLRLAEVYDREGFHAYHIAEHHSTPLGMASAPSVFLAALAQRTRRLAVPRHRAPSRNPIVQGRARELRADRDHNMAAGLPPC